MHTVQECLNTLGVSQADLGDCANLKEEFSKIKKSYRERVLDAHPDKGGDPAVFRSVRTSFEVLRDLYSQGRVSSFASASTTAQEATSYEQTWEDFEGMPVPSWDFFYTAAEEEEPLYRIELAKSGRSKCVQKGAAKKCSWDPPLIDKDTVRIGWMNEDTGTYGRWVHLNCWRVPSKVWLGLADPEQCDDCEQFAAALRGMNEVLLSGFDEMPKEDQQAVTDYVMDKDNWAKKVNRKKKPKASLTREQATTEIVAPGYHAPREKFVIPVPGKEGAQPDALAGKTFVCTGIFPEVGGGSGLSLGKARVKSMIEAFGGRVTGSVSGKTDVLVVGKDPGMSKVSKARERPKVQLVNLKELRDYGIQAGRLEDAPKAVIGQFSAGYSNNGLALTASKQELAIAAGAAEPPKRILESSTDKKPPAKKTKKAAAAKKAKANAPATKKAAPTAASKSKKKKKVEKFAIACDGCGVDCSRKSWFVEQDGTDWCDTCKENCGKAETAVMQVYGVTV